MFSKPIHIKSIAAFLLLFVCMNAGGAVCVAYCRNVVLSASAEHCPIPKQERHCDTPLPNSGDITALAATKFDCCPMIVSFIPGTLEAKQRIGETPTASAVLNFTPRLSLELLKYRFSIIPAYRGPPKDESVLHITNRTLRI